MDVPVTEPANAPVPSQPVPPAPSTATPVPVQPALPRRRSGGLLNVLLAVAVLVAVGGVSFAVGRATAPPRTFAGIGTGGNFPGGVRPNGGTGAPGAAGGLGGRQGGLSLRGTVSAVGSGTITVTLTNGTSITVGTDGTTTYHQQVAGTATDVASGKQVIVQLGSFDRTGTGAPGTQPSGPIGTATDVTVVSP